MTRTDRKPFYRQKRFWIRLALAPVVLVLVAWVIVWIEVRRGLAEFRARAIPTNNAELDNYYQLPDGCKDSTELWLAAIQAARDPYPWNDDTDALRGTRTVPDLSGSWEHQARELVASHHGAFEKMHAAAEAGGGIRFPSRVEDGLWLVQHTYESRTILSLLRTDALLAAYDGDFSRVVRNIDTMLAFAKATQLEVSLNAFNHSICYDYVSTTIAQTKPERWDEPDRKRLQLRLAAIDLRFTWMRFMSGFVADTMSDLETKSPLYLHSLNQREAIRFFSTVLPGESQTWPEIYDRHCDAIIDFEERYYSSDFKRAVYRPLGGEVGYPTIRLTEFTAKLETRARCAIVILAAARHWHRHGAYPNAARDIDKDLFPENSIPVDPWLPTEHIKLIGTEKSLIAYGVGPDQTDDKAQVEYVDGEGPNDIGVTWPIGDNQ